MTQEQFEKLKVGDKVRLKKSSEYWGQSGDTIGTVIQTEEHTFYPDWIKVEWGNGKIDSYESIDIEPAGEPHYKQYNRKTQEKLIRLLISKSVAEFFGEEEKKNDLIDYNTLLKHVKENGITLVEVYNHFKWKILDGTKLYFGIDVKGNLSTWDSDVEGKNEEFDYEFDYEWSIYDDHTETKYRIVEETPVISKEVADYAEHVIKNNIGLDDSQSYNSFINKTNKKTFMKTLKSIPKQLEKLFDADTKALYKRDYLDSELELTETGKNLLLRVLFDKKKNETKTNKELMADIAREEIKEIEAKK
jgi:hypothetical protein